MSMITNLLSTKFIADSVTKPGNSPVFGNPEEFGMEYEDVTFKARDGVTLSGWLVKGGTDKVIVLTHFGIQSSRSGYTPKGKGLIKVYNRQIDYLNTVKHLVKKGYSVLMYDLRNHGNSDIGTIPWITGGVEEYKDVLAAVSFISTYEKYKNASFGLFSMCMGANSTTYSYGIKGGLQEYKNIKALIAIQPIIFVDFLKGFGVSKDKIEKVNKFNLERGGKDFLSSPLPHVKDISVPTMLVQGEGDPWANMEWIKQFYNELQVEKEMFWIQEITKRVATYDYFNNSPEKMLKFFNKYL